MRRSRVGIQFHPGLPVVLANPRKARVVCDSVEPRRKPIAIFECAQFAKGFQEAILAKIHGFIRVADHAPDEVINGPFPLAYKEIERFRVTFENPLDDPPVVGHHNLRLSSDKKGRLPGTIWTIQRAAQFYLGLPSRRVQDVEGWNGFDQRDCRGSSMRSSFSY